MCSVHVFCTRVLNMYSVHVFCTCILYTCSEHVFCTCVLYMCSVNVFCTCIALQYGILIQYYIVDFISIAQRSTGIMQQILTSAVAAVYGGPSSGPW